MKFTGFTQNDFDTFHIDGLDERMEAIRERIQPKFKALGDELVDELSMLSGSEMHLHIAKHARRSVNPPNDTWLAIAANKRGYKKHPHFQIGLFDDHVFMWLAFIYELPNKQEIAKSFIENTDEITALPDDYVISLDHTKKEATSHEQIDLYEALVRFRDVKKAEFLVGRHFAANDPLLQNSEKFLTTAKQTFETLMPLYNLSFQ